MAKAKNKKGLRGELIAEESLEFVVSLEKQSSIIINQDAFDNDHDENCYCDCNSCKNCRRSEYTFFKFEFGIRGKDGNKYPFTIEMMKTDEYDDEINVVLSLVPSGGEFFLSDCKCT